MAADAAAAGDHAMQSRLVRILRCEGGNDPAKDGQSQPIVGQGYNIQKGEMYRSRG